MNNKDLKDEFLKLLNEHQGIIHHVCALYADKTEDRKDLLQEITFQLWKSFKSFRNQSKFSTWLYRVSLNTAVSHIRKNKKMSFTSLEGVDLIQSDYLSQADDKVRHLYENIVKLSEIDRAVILLYLEEKSYGETSDILGISVSNVGVRINRIKSKLEKMMKDN